MKAQRRADALQLQQQCRTLIAELQLGDAVEMLASSVQSAMRQAGHGKGCTLVPRVVEHLLSNDCSCPDLTKLSLDTLRTVATVLQDIGSKRSEFHAELRALQQLLTDAVSGETATAAVEHSKTASWSATNQVAERVQAIMATVEETEAVLQGEWTELVNQLKEVDTSRSATAAAQSPELPLTTRAADLFADLQQIASASPEPRLVQLADELVAAWHTSQDAVQRVSSLNSDNKHMREIAQVYQRAKRLDGELRTLSAEMLEFEKSASDSNRLHGKKRSSTAV